MWTTIRCDMGRNEIVKRALATKRAGLGGGGEETFINPTAPRRAMGFMEYPYVLAENFDVKSIDGIVIRLKLPYVLSSKWRKLVRKVLRMDRVNTNAAYVW